MISPWNYPFLLPFLATASDGSTPAHLNNTPAQGSHSDTVMGDEADVWVMDLTRVGQSR